MSKIKRTRAQRYEDERLVNEAKFKTLVENKDGRVLEKYINNDTKILLKCQNGHEWKVAPTTITKGTWCKECFKKSIRKYNVDMDFFNRDTEESFYWAGFIAADGSIRKDGGLDIQLSIKDIKHLEKFKFDIKSEHPIKIKNCPGHNYGNEKICKDSTNCCLIIGSVDVGNSLKRFGIINNKTYIYDMPEWLKTHQYIRHFIRGYIDGDGCFCDCGTSIHFSLKATANFLNSFNEVLKNNNIIFNAEIINAQYGKLKPAFNVIGYSGIDIIQKMYHFLYDNSTIFLKRKFDIISKFENIKLSRYKNKIEKANILEKNKNDKREKILEFAYKFKSLKNVAKAYCLSRSNMSNLIINLGIHDEFWRIIKGYNYNDIKLAYKELNDFKIVGEKFGLSPRWVKHILNR
jgi:hypothetical protein